MKNRAVSKNVRRRTGMKNMRNFRVFRLDCMNSGICDFKALLHTNIQNNIRIYLPTQIRVKSAALLIGGTECPFVPPLN